MSDFTGSSTDSNVPAEFSEIQSYRVRFWDLAVQMAFLLHDNPSDAVDAAVVMMREHDAAIIKFAEETARDLKAGAR